MAKDLCILHANCQGEALLPLLLASPHFSRLFEVRQILNYAREDLDSGDLSRASLLLQQYLAPKWGDLSTDAVADRLTGGATHIILPNFFFMGYWPYWTNKIQAIDFANSALEDLLNKGLDIEAILLLYLKENNPFFVDMEKNIAESQEKEAIKESHTPIKYLDIIQEHWQREQLFLTVNHPGVRLLFHTANEILRMLDLPVLSQRIMRDYVHPQGDFWLPIHPAVGSKFNLTFAARDREYPCFGTEITHRDFVQYYLACRKHGIRDLIGVLRGLGQKNR